MNRAATRLVLAMTAAGTVGTVANTAALVAVHGGDRLPLGLAPARYAVAIALCGGLPLLHRWLAGARFWAAGALWLSGAASLLAKLVFGAAAAWPEVVAFNLVYALAALVIYWLIAGRRSGAERH